MATVTPKLTVQDFQEQYGELDRAYEYWYGEARPKGMPTWVHGLLQKIVMFLLDEAGFESAGEVELRIDPEAYPRADVIATRTQPVTGPYPSRALDVVVEVISEDNKLPNIKDHCRKYKAWGFGEIYLVDASDGSVQRWKEGFSTPVEQMAGIPAGRIWEELDRRMQQLGRNA